MKKLILSVLLVAFTAAVQAGDAKTCDKDKAACCPKAKAEAQAKAGCCPATKEAKANCPFAKDGKETASKPLTSPKAKG